MHAPRDSGQAAVEAAITLPLMIFLILGTIQLFMLMQGRAMAHYAVARAARAGSLKFGECDAIRHTAITALLPTFSAVRTPLELADGFDARKNGYYAPARDSGHSEPIFWIVRDSPRPRQNEEELFDLGSAQPQTLVLRLIFFYPLRIPFANWVISAILLGHYRLQNLSGADPLLPTRADADWSGTGNIANDIGRELVARARRKHYVAPIQVSYSMRMMTPARPRNFPRAHCPPYP